MDIDANAGAQAPSGGPEPTESGSQGTEVPQRVIIPEEEKPTLDQMTVLWGEQDLYIDYLEAKLSRNEASKREHLLVVRLATKEQELQELSNQIAELKAAQSPSVANMRNALLDPAVNIIVQKLKQELDATKSKLAQTTEEMSAWKFTPDSVTGKRLMAKCRQLLQENEEIGKMISSGRLAKLEGELSMQKCLVEEMKKNQLETDDFVQELDEDMEGMQSTIYFLQQQLKESKETVAQLEAKLESVNSKDDSSKNKETEEDSRPKRRRTAPQRFDSSENQTEQREEDDT